MSQSINDYFLFADAHVHFYDMNHPTLHYGHWQPDEDHPVLGAQTRKLGEKNFLAEDFIELANPHGMVKAVHVQAAIGSKDPVEETKWLQSVRENTGFPSAIVGYVDLRGQDAQTQIERHLEYSAFRGIRDFSYGDYLTSQSFQEGYSLLSEYDLVASIAAEPQEMDKVLNLAKLYPDIPIVLDHTGLPQERTDEYFLLWKSGMKLIATAQNVICKISGLGMADNNWSIDSIRPYIETCIEIFGPNRCIFATNWPIDSLWSSYEVLIDAYKVITRHYSISEQKAMFLGNTENIYKI